MERNYVSPEQIEKARAVNVFDYLQQNEPYNLVRNGPDEYELKDHDSLIVTPSNGKFHWTSRGTGGINAIDFLVKVRGYGFVEAVQKLAGDVLSFDYTSDKRATSDKPKIPKPKAQEYVPFFELPEANSHNDDVIEYLKGRGIPENIINACIEKKLLYQTVKYKRMLSHVVDGKEEPLYQVIDGKKLRRYETIKGGCVFVGYDKENNPKFAFERDTKSDHKKDMAGSNKAFGFCMPPSIGGTKNHKSNMFPNGEQNESERLYIFEGAIDCLSHAAITQIGGVDWDGYRLSLGGVSSLALNTFLENNPQISAVYLCLDYDKPGKEATERISKELLGNDRYSHISIYAAPPPVGKDFNDTLKFMQKKIIERDLQAENIADDTADAGRSDNLSSANRHHQNTHDIQKLSVGKKRSETAL